MIAAAVLAVGVAFYDVTVTAAGLLVGLVVLMVGALTMTACGFAVASRVPNAKSVGAVGLIILLPLSFFSDVFVVGGPEWMRTVGSFFPLLHVQRVLKAAWDPGGAEIAWASARRPAALAGRGRRRRRPLLPLGGPVGSLRAGQ